MEISPPFSFQIPNHPLNLSFLLLEEDEHQASPEKSYFRRSTNSVMNYLENPPTQFSDEPEEPQTSRIKRPRFSDDENQTSPEKSYFRQSSNSVMNYPENPPTQFSDEPETSRNKRPRFSGAAEPAADENQTLPEKSYFRQSSNSAMSYLENPPTQFSDEAEEPETSRIKRARFSGEPPAAGKAHQRRLWVKDRSKDWWEKCSHPDFPAEEFKRAFKMSRATFELICAELEAAVTKKDTMLRAAIPVNQRVAVCVWRLATGEPLRLVSRRFGLGISTCHKLVLEVCAAIKNVLMPKFLQWPDEDNINKIKSEFEALSGIANVGGAMYTTHIPIIAPKISVAAYFNNRHTERNQKTSYSITVQGVVDHRGVFTDVCIGWPGSMHDDQVLEKSALFQRATRGLLRDVWIVGTSGYPLMDFVLVPYNHRNLTWTQHAFNEKIGEVQGVAKEAFRRLKGRWGCLQKRTEVKLQDLPAMLGACCVLHNICEMRGEEMDDEVRFDLFDDEVAPENLVRSTAAVQARDNIAHNLLHHGLAGTSFL